MHGGGGGGVSTGMGKMVSGWGKGGGMVMVTHHVMFVPVSVT